ncbi:hypothetical protein CYMTET_48060 [Cymbomonas tetramitiformis]|uniref:Uncharacterized protein n=1 Tax=Cymbomonas tetramitiformis TaxID=36881 RepID=A0AAE0EW43_9CHLO|nr:hypothetical protein CYMTET_48060 [Cymbomonas tetramitiformis]
MVASAHFGGPKPERHDADRRPPRDHSGHVEANRSRRYPTASTGVSTKVALQKVTGQTIPLCGNTTCTESRLRHWHRDCPRGGTRSNGAGEGGAHAFAAEDVENDFCAINF